MCGAAKTSVTCRKLCVQTPRGGRISLRTPSSGTSLSGGGLAEVASNKYCALWSSTVSCVCWTHVSWLSIVRMTDPTRFTPAVSDHPKSGGECSRDRCMQVMFFHLASSWLLRMIAFKACAPPCHRRRHLSLSESACSWFGVWWRIERDVPSCCFLSSSVVVLCFVLYSVWVVCSALVSLPGS